jgi:hypothetical protein
MTARGDEEAEQEGHAEDNVDSAAQDRARAIRLGPLAGCLPVPRIAPTTRRAARRQKDSRILYAVISKSLGWPDSGDPHALAQPAAVR